MKRKRKEVEGRKNGSVEKRGEGRRRKLRKADEERGIRQSGYYTQTRKANNHIQYMSIHSSLISRLSPLKRGRAWERGYIHSSRHTLTSHMPSSHSPLFSS